MTFVNCSFENDQSEECFSVATDFVTDKSIRGDISASGIYMLRC